MASLNRAMGNPSQDTDSLNRAMRSLNRVTRSLNRGTASLPLDTASLSLAMDNRNLATDSPVATEVARPSRRPPNPATTSSPSASIH